ncbi:MAG: hypothetical protein ABEN55_18165, partial [Bradymonadaceae bacterium]
MSRDDGDSPSSSEGNRRGPNDWQFDGDTGAQGGEEAAEGPSSGGGPESGREEPGQQEIDREEVQRQFEKLLADEYLRELMQSGEYTDFRNRLREYEAKADDPARLAAVEFALANPGE